MTESILVVEDEEKSPGCCRLSWNARAIAYLLRAAAIRRLKSIRHSSRTSFCLM